MSTARTFRLAAILLAAAGSASLPPMAAAGTSAVATAVVEWDYRPRTRVAAGRIMWACSGNVCTGTVVDSQPAMRRACYRLARRIGRIVQFGTPSGPLSEEGLARCNRARR